jgi:hypothetical protein
MSQDFDVLREIAKQVNSTNQRIGQLLNEHGYRHENGEPTDKAKDKEWVQPYRLDCSVTSWKWNVQSVLAWLRQLEAKNPGTITPKKIPQPRNK